MWLPKRPSTTLFGPAVGVAVTAFLVRLVLGGVLLHAWSADFPAASDDGDAYDAAARWLVWGDPILHAQFDNKWLVEAADPSARWPAAYWLFLAAQYRVWGHEWLSTVLFQAVLGAAGTLAAYRLGQRLLPERVAILAGYGVALSSTGVYLSAALYAEALYIPLLLMALWLTLLTVADQRPGFIRACSAGVCFGLAIATRPLGIAVLGVAGGWVLLVGRDGWRGPTRVRWRRLSGLLLGCAAALAPFMARDLLTLGRIEVFTAGGSEAFSGSGLASALAGLNLDPYQSGFLATLYSAATNAPAFGQLLMDGLPYRLWLMFLGGGWGPLGDPVWVTLGWVGPAARGFLWLLAGYGVVYSLRSTHARARSAWLLVFVALAIIVPALLLGSPLVRYRAPADPIFIVWMVVGGSSLYSARRKRPSAVKEQKAPVPLGVPALFLVPPDTTMPQGSSARRR